MLIWVIVFLVIAMISSIFGFERIINASLSMARLIFLIFIALFIIRLVFDIGDVSLIEL